ncbi:MAG: hypothetical protein Q9180_003174 [Flavoplaca navasiana]
MGLSNILRKLLTRKPEPPEVRQRGSNRGKALSSTKSKKPTRAIASSHTGAYDPIEKNLHRTVKDSHGGDWQPDRHKTTYSHQSDSHGGDWQPDRYKTTPRDQRNDHGGDYRPKFTNNNYSAAQAQQPNPTSRDKRQTNSRRVNRSRRRHHHVEAWDAHHAVKDDEEAGLVSRKRNQLFHHRDILKRPYSGLRDTRFLNPKNGKPTKLIVQSSEEVLANRPSADWERKSTDNAGPWVFRLAHWATADGGRSVVVWLPACAVLTIVLLNPFPVTVNTRNNGSYEPVPYKDWQYPYDARNRHENPPSKNAPIRPLIGQIERVSEPAYLCLAEGMKVINVQQWREANGKDVALEYIMVSYTGEQLASDDDRYSLHVIGKHAAEAAGVKAYWVGCSCLGKPTEVEENVWRISDVIRGAFQMVIAVAGPVGVKEMDKLPTEPLSQWGDRVWTLPELLLSPERVIEVYTLNRDLDQAQQLKQCLERPPHQINRRDFSRFWEDPSIVGQLLDHYEGSVILSPLELIATALKCLERRHTTQHLPGDLSYSLMGLLRQRPNARKDDSGFQAFARLSLANDSNMLLERLICLLPPSPYAPWHSFQDHWDASLWDVYPRTQVCGIGENDTVILDGARAATIRWKSFKKVILRGNLTVKRRIAVLALTFVSPFFFMAIILLAVGVGGLEAIGGVFLALSLIVLLSSPWLIKRLYLGKVWNAQPWFFGIEGYIPIHEIEKKLFGADQGRLSWSTISSSLSRHNILNHKDLVNYYEGKDPKADQEVNARIEKALSSTNSQEKIFTLVDTFTMSVTLFAAAKPPVAVLACGEEGGMQSALLCSYDWTNNTMYRETVLRMETPAYWRMSPIRRVRLGLQTRARMG